MRYEVRGLKDGRRVRGYVEAESEVRAWEEASQTMTVENVVPAAGSAAPATAIARPAAAAARPAPPPPPRIPPPPFAVHGPAVVGYAAPGGVARAGMSALGIASLVIAPLAAAALWEALVLDADASHAVQMGGDRFGHAVAWLLFMLSAALATVGVALGLGGVLQTKKRRRLAAWALAGNAVVAAALLLTYACTSLGHLS